MGTFISTCYVCVGLVKGGWVLFLRSSSSLICCGVGERGWLYWSGFRGNFSLFIFGYNWYDIILGNKNYVWGNFHFWRYGVLGKMGGLNCNGSYAVCKVTFKRKGAWLRMRRVWPRFISLKFGHGHFNHINFEDGFFIRRKKYLQRHSLVLGGLWFMTLFFGKYIKNFRYFGRYTKRGVRLARELFYRQQGKESQYTKLKSKIF